MHVVQALHSVRVVHLMHAWRYTQTMLAMRFVQAVRVMRALLDTLVLQDTLAYRATHSVHSLQPSQSSLCVPRVPCVLK